MTDIDKIRALATRRCMPPGVVSELYGKEIFPIERETVRDLCDEVEKLRAAVTVDEEMVERGARAAFFQDDLGGHIKGPWNYDTIPDVGRENYRLMVHAVLCAALPPLRESKQRLQRCLHGRTVEEECADCVDDETADESWRSGPTPGD